MSPATPTSPTVPSGVQTFDTAEEWHHALCDVPLRRIVFNPLPGTATEADLLRMVEQEKRLVELIDATLVEKAVGSYESLLASLIIQTLLNFIRPRNLGVVGGEAFMTRTTKGRVRMPDVSYTSFDRLPDHKASRKAIADVTPDLAVEVLSESNTRAEIDQKLREFFASGTRLAWVANPKTETVEVYVRSSEPDRVLKIGDILDGGEVLVGFQLSLEELFHTYK